MALADTTQGGNRPVDCDAERPAHYGERSLEIRYSDDVKTRFDEAQAARIAVDKARADQESARVAAETRKITAGGEADANRILSESLTDQVLRQRYIEALAQAGTIYVVPPDASPVVQIPPAAGG